MSYAHQGPAHVTVSARWSGTDPVDVLNESVTINLAGAGTPGIARLEFSQPLKGPQRFNWISVLLPNNLVVAGSILQGERAADGSGWLTFQVKETDLGLS